MDPNLLRVLTEESGLRIVATFPGDRHDEEAVYGERGGAPAFVVVKEVWGGRGLDKALADLGTRMVGLADQCGCPVAALVGVWTFEFQEPLRSDFVGEQARQHRLLVVFGRRGRVLKRTPGAQLFWHEPTRPSLNPALPPFPGFRWTSLQEGPAGLGGLAEAEPVLRKEKAEGFSRAMRERLKYAPAMLLVRGPEVIDETVRLLSDLLGHLENPAGRRYVLWSLIYLGGFLCFDVRFLQTGWPGLETLFAALTGRWETWTTKERRVIVRGLRLLGEKADRAELPPESPFWNAMRGWAEQFLDRPEYAAGWIWTSQAEDFLASPPIARLIPARRLEVCLRQQEERRWLLAHLVGARVDEFFRAPSVACWRELQPLLAAAQDAARVRRTIGWCLARAGGPEFWTFVDDLEGQDREVYAGCVWWFLAGAEEIGWTELEEKYRSKLRPFWERTLQAKDLEGLDARANSTPPGRTSPQRAVKVTARQEAGLIHGIAMGRRRDI